MIAYWPGKIPLRKSVDRLGRRWISPDCLADRLCETGDEFHRPFRPANAAESPSKKPTGQSPEKFWQRRLAAGTTLPARWTGEVNEVALLFHFFRSQRNPENGQRNAQHHRRQHKPRPLVAALFSFGHSS